MSWANTKMKFDVRSKNQRIKIVMRVWRTNQVLNLNKNMLRFGFLFLFWGTKIWYLGTESPGHFVLPPKTLNFGLKASLSLFLSLSYIYTFAQRFPKITNFCRRDLQFWFFPALFLSFSLPFCDSDGGIREKQRKLALMGRPPSNGGPAFRFTAAEVFSSASLFLLLLLLRLCFSLFLL